MVPDTYSRKLGIFKATKGKWRGIEGNQRLLGMFPVTFLTRELRMRNTSYRELWENVSLDRSIRCKLYANEVRTLLTIKLLSNLN